MRKWMKWFGPLAVSMTLILAGCGGSSSSNVNNDGTPGEDDQNPPVEEALSVTLVPANGSIGVALDTPIYATFSKEMDETTLNDENTIYLTTTADTATHIEGTKTYAGKVLTFTPTVYLDANVSYRFVVTTGAATTEGEHLATTHAADFMTGTALLSAPSAVVTSMAPSTVTVDTDEAEVLAPVTGALLGTSLEVDALGWQGLADADIPLADLLGSLNDQLDAATLQDLLADSMPLGDFLGVTSALLEVQNASDAQALVEQLLAAVTGEGLAGVPVPLGNLLQLPAGLSDLSVDDVKNLLDTQANRISALSLLSALNGAVNPTLGTPVELPLSLPPLLESTVRVQTVTPPAVAVLAEGETTHSSATRVHMDLGVGGEDISELTDLLSGMSGTITDSDLVNGLLDLTGGLLGVLGLGDTLELGEHLDPSEQTVRLPLYLELGSSEAQVIQLDSGDITMDVTTGLARLYVGTIDENLFFTQEFLSADDFEPVEILNVLGLITVSAKGYAVGESDMQEMHFLPIPVEQTEKSINPAGTNVNALLVSLLGNLELTISVLGIELDASDLTALNETLQGVVANALLPVAGTLLDTVSELLGVYVGSAEISVLGVVE
jgi:uncharacterized membrane protein